jgi:hypothetical protein
MKTKYTTSLFSKINLAVCFLVLVCNYGNAQNTFPANGAAGIGTTIPNASSLLEIKSTTKGLLISRMTKNQRDAIASPATGLLIYQTNSTPGFYYYDSSAWNAVTPKAKGWSLAGNAGTNPATNFIGTTDAQPLIFKVNNLRSGLIDYNTSNTGFGYRALIANTTGHHNTATGAEALLTNTTGYYNTANGYQSLYTNANGFANTATGFSLFTSIHQDTRIQPLGFMH